MITRCTLVTGFLGTGKTTLLRHLLAQRPAGERWAVLVNDFGAVGLDGTALASAPTSQSEVVVREVAGGCVCCAATVPLRVALTDVLRRLRPDRLLIEPSGLGRPSAVLAILREPGLASALAVGAVLCVIDARQLDPTDPAQSSPHADTWREQVECADVLVVNKIDLADDAVRTRLADWVAARYPPPAALVRVEHGRVDATLLDRPPVPRWTPVLLPATPSVPPTGHMTAVPGLGERHEIVAGALASAGWLIDPAAVPAFDLDGLQTLLLRLPSVLAARGWRLLRAKGALHTTAGGRLVQWAGGRITIEPLALRTGSRFELLADRATHTPDFDAGTAAIAADWTPVEALLRAGRADAN